MTTQDENEKISTWAGIGCRCEAILAAYTSMKATPPHEYWTNCPRHSNGGLPPDYDRDEVAVGLIEILLERGYSSHLNASLAGDSNTYDYFIRGFAESVCQPTIAAAIKAAVKKLLEEEVV